MLIGREHERAAVEPRLPDDASTRARFLAASAVGMAHILGGDAAAGAEAIREAVVLAESSPELREDM